VTAATTTAPRSELHVRALTLYRDDGPIARTIGRLVARARPAVVAAADDSSGRTTGAAADDSSGRATGVVELALVLVAAVPLLAVIAVGGADVSDPVAGAAVAWAVLCGGVSTGFMAHHRLRWALLPVLRSTEYAAVLWLAVLAGSSSRPAAFALLAAVAFRQYDLVYRMRLRGTGSAPWVSALSLGWDGRLIGAWLLLALGALPAGFYVAAAVFGIAFVGEAVSGWMASDRPLAYEDDEEDE
jgi:uncharacterized protein DUF5941